MKIKTSVKPLFVFDILEFKHARFAKQCDYSSMARMCSLQNKESAFWGIFLQFWEI